MLTINKDGRFVTVIGPILRKFKVSASFCTVLKYVETNSCKNKICMTAVCNAGFLLYIFSLPFNNNKKIQQKLTTLFHQLWPSVSAGVKGNLTESEGYILAHLVVTGTTILLTVYFLVWQTYVMMADVIISSVLLVLYGLDGVLAFSTLARLARSVPLSLVFHHRHFVLILTSHDRWEGFYWTMWHVRSQTVFFWLGRMSA